jgi:hypothetical protein
MTAQGSEALDVLRQVWHGHEQTADDLDCEAQEDKACKKMVDAGVGFDDFAAEGEDPREAWRARLAREGKLAESGGTVRDLVLGEPAPSPAERH